MQYPIDNNFLWVMTCDVINQDDLTFPTQETFFDIIKEKNTFENRLELYYKCKHIYTMFMGKIEGWWELSWDIYGNRNVDLYPIKLVVINKDDITITQMSSLLCELGIFKSNKEAKRNGWDKPIEIGDYFLKKKTYILRIK